MTSPFVRFSRFVRSPLSLATLGLCALWGCRHLPVSRPLAQQDIVRSPDAAVQVPTPVGRYEPPADATITGSSKGDAPIVSLSEGDVFLPLPEERNSAPTTEARSPKPEDRSATETTSPMEESPASGPLPEAVAAPPSPTVNKPSPAPSKDLFEDEPSVPSKLDVPPEPAPTFEPQASGDSKPFEVTSTSVSNPPITELTKLDNEVLSLESYCTGLVFDSQGFGYVSCKNRIVRFSPTGATNDWATLSHPTGHRIEPEGTHLVCDAERRAVLRLSFDGKLVGVAAKDCDGAPLRAPHDIAVDPQSGFYFTDPGYVQVKTPTGKLHYVDRTGKVSVVAAKMGFPTGVVFDAARHRVLVAESQFNRILEFRLTEPGKIESHEVLLQLPKIPNVEYHLASLCLDADGNLYVTHQQGKWLQAFDAKGRSLGRFSTGALSPSSVALRSPEVPELFVTGELDAPNYSGKVIRLDLGR